MIEERLVNLEVKFSHQEEFIYQLNRVVTEQQQRIEKLEKELLEQRQILEAAGSGESKPPHY